MPTVTPQVLSPLPGFIVQRDQNNTANVPIDVQATGTGTVYAQFDPVQGGTAIAPVKIGDLVNGRAKGAVAVMGGDYKCTITIQTNGVVVGTTVVDRVGVGLVFVIWGHSVAAGDQTPIYNNPDARVRVANYADEKLDESKLPNTFSPLSDLSHIGPFGAGPYAWGPFANKIATSQNVPVLLLNTAFGGSQLLQAWKDINNIPFEHSFVKYSDGMPYRALKAALTKYIPKTGCQAILVHHGVNDRLDCTREQFRDYYRNIIQYTRSKFGLGNDMPWLLALEDAGAGNDVEHIRAATTDVIGLEPNVYQGADLLALRAQRAGRPDTIHLQPSDWDAYATLWANAVLGVIPKTKPLTAQLSADYPVVNGGLSLAAIKAKLPGSQTLILIIAGGAALALFATRRPIPALVSLLFVAFVIGQKVEKKALSSSVTTN